MDELEQLFRESFARHADEVDVSIAVPVKKRPSWAIPILAAAAAVTVVASGVMVLDDDEPESGEPQPSVVVPADWRVEQWRNVQVSVPPDWGWGGAPTPDFITTGRGAPGSLIDCGVAAFVDPTGKKLLNGDRELPYVGRPQFMTDVCMGFDPRTQVTPTAPSVWLGTPLEVGTRELSDGWVQETIEVAGSTVTVTTLDDRLRSQILASARPAEGSCAPTLPPGPSPAGDLADIEKPTEMAVCVYAGGDADSGWQLTYSTRVDAVRTATFLDALPDHELQGAGEPGTNEIIVLHVSDARLVVRLSSFSTIELNGVYELTPATVRPWAVDGIPAYVTGPTGYDPALQPYFRGMLG